VEYVSLGEDSFYKRKWEYLTQFKFPVCELASPHVSGDTPYKVDTPQIKQRASLLQRYLSDEQKELQALYALQALMVHMEQPASEY